jgi:lysophospholipase L1-like esterase
MAARSQQGSGGRTGARLAQVGFALAGLALGAAIVEACCRLALDDGYYVWPPGLEMTLEPDPEIVPGVSGTSRLTINGLGMRGDAFGDDPQYRILAVGGSTTWCAYLDDAETWPQLVEERLDAVLGSGAVWVGNVGKPGHTTVQHVLQVEKLLEQHPRIDAVVLLVGVNDLLVSLLPASAWSAGLARGRGSGSKQAADAALRSAFSVLPRGSVDGPWHERTGLGHWWASRHPEAPAEAAAARITPRGESVLRWRAYRRRASRFREDLPDLSAPLERYARDLEAIAAEARARGVRPIFLTQPTLWSAELSDAEEDLLWMGGPPLDRLENGAVYYSAGALAAGMRLYNERLLRTCREHGVECLDVAARLPRDTTVFYDDAHFTEEGARLLAGLVAQELLAREPLASWPRRTRPPAPRSERGPAPERIRLGWSRGLPRRTSHASSTPPRAAQRRSQRRCGGAAAWISISCRPAGSATTRAPRASRAKGTGRSSMRTSSAGSCA